MLDKLKQSIGFNPVAWTRAIGRMRRVVRDYVASADTGDGPPNALVLITPWVGTSVPWFSLALGLLLSGSGARVTFAIDGSRFGPNPLRYRFILGAIRRVMTVVARSHRVVELATLAPGTGTPMPPAQIARLARLNARWAFRGEMVTAGRASFEAICRDQISAADERIAGFVGAEAFDMALVPGGVYGSSGAWVYHLRERGVRVATYDTGGYETTMLAADGLACQLQDIPRAFTAVSKRIAEHPDERSAVLGEAKSEIAKRKGGTDTFESQVKGGGGGAAGLDGGILLALNSSWDAAALGPHRIFDGNSEWIVETVRLLLDTTDATVIVRQHPAERLPFAYTTDDYRKLLDDAFGDNPRVRLIAAADPVNSYVLLERVAAVVVHSSTIGIEAAAFGRPVITGSSPYYGGLGFVFQADSVADYARLLGEAAAGRLEVTPQMQEDAEVCFYVTQCCNWVFSPFNPADFARWSREPLAHWAAQRSVRRMVQSLKDDIPVAYLNHLDRVGAAAE